MTRCALATSSAYKRGSLDEKKTDHQYRRQHTNCDCFLSLMKKLTVFILQSLCYLWHEARFAEEVEAFVRERMA
jgi:hypothetical protein